MIRLVILDIDGTLLQAYSWQYIHQNLGTWIPAQENRKRFVAGEITYEDWARLDAKLWKSQPISRIIQLVDQMPYTRGAQETIFTLNQNKISVYLLSAGLTIVGERIKRENCINGYAANHLESVNEILTGNVAVRVSFNQKGELLDSILQRFNLVSHECAAVGDDPTLIPLFKKVGLGIAFNPLNHEVEEHAHVIVKHNDLRRVLPYILKYPQV
jgi:phosphoserine phosphatase